MTLTEVKLTIKDWALGTMALITGVVTLLLFYKNKQLHAAHVQILRDKYANAIEAVNAQQQGLRKQAKAASTAYSDARVKYEEKHGPFEPKGS